VLLVALLLPLLGPLQHVAVAALASLMGGTAASCLKQVR